MTGGTPGWRRGRNSQKPAACLPDDAEAAAGKRDALDVYQTFAGQAFAGGRVSLPAAHLTERSFHSLKVPIEGLEELKKQRPDVQVPILEEVVNWHLQKAGSRGRDAPISSTGGGGGYCE